MVKKICIETLKKLRELKADKSLDKEEIKKRLKKIKQWMEKQIKDILTPEQLRLYNKLFDKKKRRGDK